MSTNTELMHDIRWRIHMPNLLKEILCTPGTSILAAPLNILGEKLYELAEIAVKINDPRLHLMMMDLTLYTAADPLVTDLEEIRATRDELIKQISDMENA